MAGRRAVGGRIGGREDAAEEEGDQLGRTDRRGHRQHRVVAGEDHPPQELGSGRRFEAQAVAVGFEQGGERFDVGPGPSDHGGPIEGGPPHAGRREQLPDARGPLEQDLGRSHEPRLERQGASTAASAAATGAGSSAVSRAAWISASLSGKTRKIVPSATPAASAISRVVTFGAVRGEQRQRGGHDGGAALGRREGGRPGATGRSGRSGLQPGPGAGAGIGVGASTGTRATLK